MFGIKSKVINATLAASFAIPLATAGMFTSAGSAQAAILSGSIGLNGTSLVPNDGVNPINTNIQFVDVDGVDAYGDFAAFLPSLNSGTAPITGISINPLNLTRTSIESPITAKYSTGSVSPFIDFGYRTLGSTYAQLTFDLDDSEITRTAIGNAFIGNFALTGITGNFNFDGQTIAKGFLSATLSGDASTYQLTIATTPEPTTILGLSLVGAGMVMSRRRKTQASA